MRNDNQKADDGAPGKAKRGFRGTWAPPEVFHLLEEKKINTTEFVLLLTVDSLVHCRGEGCWASNAALAKQIGGVQPDHVRRLVKHLEELGLIIRKGTKVINGKHFRMIEVCWSRLVNESTASNKTVSENTGSINAAKSTVSPSINAGQSTTEESTTPASRPADACGGVCSSKKEKKNASEGLLAQKAQAPLLKIKSSTLPSDVSLAQRLMKAAHLALKVKPEGSLAGWSDALAKLRRDVDQSEKAQRELLCVLEWCIKYFGHEDFPEYLIPRSTKGIRVSIYLDWRKKRRQTLPDKKADRVPVKIDLGNGRARYEFQDAPESADGPPVKWEQRKQDDGKTRLVPVKGASR